MSVLDPSVIKRTLVSALAFAAISTLPVVLAGCKPGNGTGANGNANQTENGTNGTNGSTPAPRVGTGEVLPAPAENPDLAQDVFDAIIAEDEQRAVELVEQGVPANMKYDRDISLLHYACRATMPELTRTLLKYGADVDFAIQGGTQPIHWASRAGTQGREGAKGTIDALIEYGADINAATDSGTRPIDFTYRLADHEYAETWREFLISRGAQP